VAGNKANIARTLEQPYVDVRMFRKPARPRQGLLEAREGELGRFGRGAHAKRASRSSLGRNDDIARLWVLVSNHVAGGATICVSAS
jgi:hypothetical protein